MGFFSNLGKSITNVGRSIGKGVSSVVSKIGKTALSIAKPISAGLDFAVSGVKKVAGLIGGIPIIGSAAKALLETPLGKQVSSVFSTVEGVNEGLKDAIDIGQKVVDFSDDVNATLSKSSLSTADIDSLVAKAGVVGKHIQSKPIAKKAKSVPEVNKQIKHFNSLVKKIEKKGGKASVERIKRLIAQN